MRHGQTKPEFFVLFFIVALSNKLFLRFQCKGYDFATFLLDNFDKVKVFGKTFFRIIHKALQKVIHSVKLLHVELGSVCQKLLLNVLASVRH